jgi:hypothetical protein
MTPSPACVPPSVATLQTLVDGLMVPSETDEPFTVVNWPDTQDGSIEAVLKALDLDPEQTVEMETVQSFLDPLGQTETWFSDSDQETAGRFRTLRDYLQATLSDLRVYRIGHATKTVLVLGRSGCTGQWLGLRTRVVET